jgi:hypothetical protein
VEIAHLREDKDADARTPLVQLEHSLIADPWGETANFRLGGMT